MSFTVSTKWSRWLTLIWDSPHRSCEYLSDYSPRLRPFPDRRIQRTLDDLFQEGQAVVPPAAASVASSQIMTGSEINTGQVRTRAICSAAWARARSAQAPGRRTRY